MTNDGNTRKALRQSRATMLICTFVAPAIYAAAIATQSLGGHWGRFFQHPSRIPWHAPRLPLIAALGVAALAAALVLPPRIRAGRSPLALARLRNLAASVLLLAVAVCGLVLGMKFGSGAAPLALCFLAAPPVVGLFLLPSEARWRRF